MAYNPFNVFRRNQKGLFAILTVFVMIMFVLSFGQGDFFQWLPRLIGSNKAKGDVMALVAGDKVREGDLGLITANRNLASDFMVNSMDLAGMKMYSLVREGMEQGTISRDQKPLFTQFLRARASQPVPYLEMTREELSLYQQIPQLRDRPEQMLRESKRNLFGGLSAVANSSASNPADADLARTAMDLMSLDEQRGAVRDGYFGHKTSDEDAAKAAFDFDLWRRKADQLGITITADEAKKYYLDIFRNQIEDAALARMEKDVFSTRQNYSRDNVFKALATEFKVHMARRVVLGRGVSVYNTPWDRYEYFQKECDGATYIVTSVPTENYIPRVTGTPSEGEMRKLFDTYKDKEADPARSNLGLREPRRLKIGWLEAKGDEPFYKKLGEESLAIGEKQAKLFLAAMAPLPGTGLGLLAAPAVMNMQDPAMSGAYAAYAENQRLKIDLNWFPNFKDPDVLNRVQLLDIHVAQPGNIAAAILAAGGGFAAQANPAFAAIMLIERARMADREARARALAALMVTPTEGGTNLFGSTLAMFGHYPKAVPLVAIRHELVEKVKTEAVRLAAQRDLLAFMTECEKLGAKPDKAEVTAYVAKFVAERGLKSGESKELRDQYTIGDDAGLATLKDKETRGHGGMNLPLQFGRSFFFEQNPRDGSMTATKGLYTPRSFPETRAPIMSKIDEPTYIAWRTAEQASEAPKYFDKAKGKIVELWKRMEARKLAETAANDLANTAREKFKNEPKSLQSEVVVGDIFFNVQKQYLEGFDAAAKERSKYFFLYDVSPIIASANRGAPPEGFRLKPKIEMPYPTQEMQTQLLDNKDKPLGTTIVMHDESKDRYFVAAVSQREFTHYMLPELQAKFYADAIESGSDLSVALREGVRGSAMRKAVDNATALLKAEFKVSDESEKMNKKADAK